MIKTIIQYIKFYFDKLFTSRYIAKGKCRQCGTCCKNIVFLIKEEYVKTDEQFQKLQEFDKVYCHFTPTGRKNEKGAMLFQCNSLGDDNLCKDYKIRSLYCRKYPVLDSKIILGAVETFDECGYTFEVDKKFQSYIK